MTYHVLGGDIPEHERIAGERKAESQEALILEFFREHPAAYYSAFDIQDVFTKWEITSVRRALSNLTTEGDLDKTDTRVMGRFGVSVVTWRLAIKKQETQTDLFNT